MAHDIDPFKLSSPRIFLVRMVVFLILCALVVVVLYRQIWTAFLANPGLNALIIGVLGIGISFSSSLFGLAGSLVLGFLDLQTSQAQNRFYTDLEDWLSTTVRDLVVDRDAPAGAAAPGSLSGDLKTSMDRLRDAISEGGS